MCFLFDFYFSNHSVTHYISGDKRFILDLKFLCDIQVLFILKCLFFFNIAKSATPSIKVCIQLLVVSEENQIHNYAVCSVNTLIW